MAKRGGMEGTWAGRRSGLMQLLHRMVAQVAASGRGTPSGLVEELEPRLLLSQTVLPTPDYAIHCPIVSLGPVAISSARLPAQLRHAYGVDQVQFGSITGDGAGQTIAIVDAYAAPNMVSDLAAFDRQFGLPAPPSLTIIGQDGTYNLPAPDPAGGQGSSSWYGETCLDVEWIHAMAPQANIVLVLANSPANADMYAAVDTARRYPGVSVVSMSWSQDEFPGQSVYNSYFTTPAGHTGVTFFAATGDNGAIPVAPQFPAVSPNVVAVGGTFLDVDTQGNYLSESGWGYGALSSIYGGAGGGISTIETQPAYQQGVVTQSTTARTIPDVAWLADPASGVPVYDSWDSSSEPWTQVGGTSLATPLWAAAMAIANQGRALAGLPTLDGATETLPRLYALPAGDFHDVITGNNGYPAGPGYDLVTGRGSPIVNRLVQDLAVDPAQPVIGALTVTPATITSGTAVTLTATDVREFSGTISNVAFYLESDSTPGLLIGSDTFLGDGTQNGSTWTFTAPTAGLTPATYTYYAVATDALAVSSPSVSIDLTVVAPTVASLTVSASQASPGTAVTLAANNVQTPTGTISDVAFYLESDSTLGLLIGSDTLLGSGTQNGGTWTFPLDTTTLIPGVYTYYAVATDDAGFSSIAASTTLTIATPEPINDMFATATVLTGTTVTITGTNVGATKEPREPNHALNVGGASVWYTWTAPYSGRVTLDTLGSDFDTVLAVYKGNSFITFFGVASNDDDPVNAPTSALTFNAVIGTTYSIAVDGAAGATGNITLHLAEASAPVNDNFAKATVLNTTAVNWTGTTVGASRELGEPLHAGNIGGASIWFAWTPTVSSRVIMDTRGSDFDTLLAVYNGATVTTLTGVTCNDDDPAGGTTSALAFNAMGGHTYYLAVAGFNGSSGNVSLQITPVLLPTNDSFANPATLVGATATWTGTNRGATRQALEPYHANNAGGASVWFTWTAPSTGPIALDTHGSNFDTTLAIFTGASVSTLTRVASNDDDPAGRTLTSALTFNAVAGRTYHIAVDGYNGSTGDITLNLSPQVGPTVLARRASPTYFLTPLQGPALVSRAQSLMLASLQPALVSRGPYVL